jgi:hypothetical protein
MAASWQSRIQPWLDMMTQTITRQPFITRDTYLKPTYGAPVKYNCRTVYKSKNIIGKDGQVVATRGYSIIATTDPIAANDLITLDDGTIATIVGVNAENDEVGPLFVRLDFQ